MLMEKSMIDYSYEALQKAEKELTFLDLISKIAEIAGVSLEEVKSKASKLYTQMSLDARFKLLPNNVWDLSERHVYSPVSYEELNADEIEKRKEKEAEKKFQKKILKAQEDFRKKITTNVDIDKDPIEWLKENAISVNATIPDHLEKIFIQQFGDQPHKVVDASRKTSGGYSMKFGPSFSIVVKAGTVIHPALEHLFKDNQLHDTSFIAKLVRDGDLNFGKNSLQD